MQERRGVGEHARVHLANRALGVVSILVFDDAGELLRLVAQHAPVARRISEVGREQRGRGGHELLQGARAQQGHVAVEHEHRGVAVDARHRLQHGVARAELLSLHDPVDIRRVEGIAHALGAVADHHVDPRRCQATDRIEHVGEQGPASQGVEDLGQVRAHARALAGGENDHFELHGIGGSACRWL